MHTKKIIESIVDKNYTKAKTFIHEAMRERIGLILEQELERLAGGLLQEKTKHRTDPVGEEDGDIDNDGDEDGSDGYLAKRRRAIAKNEKK